MGMEDKGEEDYIDLPNYQVFDPEKGPLETRIHRALTDSLKDDRVDLRDTEYWFTQPEGGWNSRPTRAYFMEEVEPEFPHPHHPPEEDEDDRIRLTELEEGKVYVGMVTDVWLYHGVQVDIGAEFDGLIPCTEEQWELAVDHLDVGEVVFVEIHKLRIPGLYRWPVQLKFVNRHHQDLMLAPDEYDAPIDWGWAHDSGLSAEDVAAITNRTLDTPTYFVPPDEGDVAQEIMEGYGTGEMYWRENPSEPVADYIDDPMPHPGEAAMMGDQWAVEMQAARESVMNPEMFEE